MRIDGIDIEVQRASRRLRAPSGRTLCVERRWSARTCTTPLRAVVYAHKSTPAAEAEAEAEALVAVALLLGWVRRGLWFEHEAGREYWHSN